MPPLQLRLALLRKGTEFDTIDGLAQLEPTWARRARVEMKGSRIHQVLQPARKTVWICIAVSLFLSPVTGQRRATPKRQTSEPHPQQTAAPFETVVAADSYKIYGEVRRISELIGSEGVKDLLEPIIKMAGSARELKALVKWVTARGELLTSARVLFAGWPSRPKLPQILVAIEFSSVEEAEKCELQLKEFLLTLLPTPVAQSSPATTNQAATPEQNKTLTRPSYALQQAGSLVFISDAPFTVKDLEPAHSKTLAEDQNFRTVHDRFSSESVVLYVDFAAIEREQNERRREYEREQQRVEAEQQAIRAQIQPNASPTLKVVESPEGSPAAPEATITATTSQPEENEISAQPSGGGGATRNGSNSLRAGLVMFPGLFFGGKPKWPEAVGAAFVFDGESYVARVLFVNSPDVNKNIPIPFIPSFVSGAPMIPESPSVLPADTELFVTASIDATKIYDGILKAASIDKQHLKSQVPTAVDMESPSPFEIYEHKLGIRIKDDLLPLLGNEVAFTIPVRAFRAGSPRPEPATSQPSGADSESKSSAGPNPVFLLAVKDREAVKALVPRIIDAMGFKGASLLAQTQKREDTEVVTYGDAVSYAFIGNFLVLSPSAQAVRHVVDSYLSHDTLSSAAAFRNYTRWQPRQVLGQVYVSPALMESYKVEAGAAQVSDRLRDFLAQISSDAEPITYAVSNEGLGSLHELHIPKNLALLVIAGISGESKQSEIARNEAVTRSAMRAIASAEASYEATEGTGRYGTLDELINAKLVSKEMLQNWGYHIELTVAGTRFEVSAVPTEYGKTGRLSFYLDETLVLRVADHAGAAATIADKPERE